MLTSIADTATHRYADRSRLIARPWQYLILTGGLLFIVALVGSAVVVPELRSLHMLQSLIYIVVIGLGLRGNVFGLGAGVSVPLIWNCLQVFITGLIRAGAGELWGLVRTGRVARVDTLFVFVGGIGHFVLIAGCLGAFLALPLSRRSWKGFLIGAFVAVAYFAAIVVVARPR